MCPSGIEYYLPLFFDETATLLDYVAERAIVVLPDEYPSMLDTAWQEIVASADHHYTPGSFTTFAAFEWTASINRGNLHRNVIFAQTSDLPLPLPAGDNIPETLWSYMELHRRHGVDSRAYKAPKISAPSRDISKGIPGIKDT